MCCTYCYISERRCTRWLLVLRLRALDPIRIAFTLWLGHDISTLTAGKLQPRKITPMEDAVIQGFPSGMPKMTVSQAYRLINQACNVRYHQLLMINVVRALASAGVTPGKPHKPQGYQPIPHSGFNKQAGKLTGIKTLSWLWPSRFDVPLLKMKHGIKLFPSILGSAYPQMTFPRPEGTSTHCK